MDTHVRTPQEIFLQPQHLVVPPFQRPYVWDKEEQWAPLWQDIRRVAEERLADAFALPTHFLGAVVVQAQEPMPGNLQASNIIDGQQRLTTLQVLMDAAACVLEEAGSQSLAGQLEVLTHNQSMYVPEGSTRLKVRHTNRDQPAFDEVMDAVPPVDHAALRHPGALVARAHEFFTTAVGEWLGDFDGEAFQPRAATLVEVLTRGLQLVSINLGVNENSQEIFETLNARGTPLTAADLIKNFVFQRLENEGVDTKHAYVELWPFDTKFWESEVSVGRYPISRSSLFFNQWLVSRLGEEIGPKATFSRFKRYVERGSGHKISDLLPVIKQQADLYQQWTMAADDAYRQLDRVQMAVYRMQASGVELLKPLLIWLHSPDRELTAATIEDVVDTAESWVIRRQLLRLPLADLGRIVADVIRSQSSAPGEELASRVRAHLSSLNVSSTYWPGDVEVRGALRVELVFRRFKKGRLRMILEAVENSHRAHTNQPQVPRRGYPIEHILPQKWVTHWPVDSPDDAEDRVAHVHRIGNLTLLTDSLNSKVSNGPWGEKRAALQQHDTLLLNSRLLAATNDAGWDEEGIDARSDRIIDAILATWPVPEGHDGTVVDPQAKSQTWIQIKHLLGAELIEPGTVLHPRADQWGGRDAVIRDDGLIEIDGRKFDSPSGAAGYVKGAVANGWRFWRLPDGRSLWDVRAVLLNQPPKKTSASFDWTTLHTILESIPEGRWASYGTIADVIGTAAQPLGNHITSCPQCVNAHRILRSDGRVAPNFAWTDPGDQRKPIDLLVSEGVAVADGKADATVELSSDEISALVDEG